MLFTPVLEVSPVVPATTSTCFSVHYIHLSVSPTYILFWTRQSGLSFWGGPFSWVHGTSPPLRDHGGIPSVLPVPPDILTCLPCPIPPIPFTFLPFSVPHHHLLPGAFHHSLTQSTNLGREGGSPKIPFCHHSHSGTHSQPTNMAAVLVLFCLV